MERKRLCNTVFAKNAALHIKITQGNNDIFTSPQADMFADIEDYISGSCTFTPLITVAA